VTDWALVSLSPFNETVLLWLAAAAVVAAMVVAWTYGWRRRALWALRLFGVALVVALLFEPAIQVRSVRRLEDRVAIVVDRSKSMAVGGRYERLRAKLTGAGALSARHEVEWFDLEGTLAPAQLELTPEGAASDLAAALERVQKSPGKPLAGILLFSDGADTEGRSVAAGETPVNTVLVADAAFQDVAIHALRADEFAFVHNTMHVDVALSAHGFSGRVAVLTLRRNDALVATREVTLADGVTTCELAVKPDQVGQFVYTVEVAALPGEALRDNNSRAFVVQVIRDKIRVLQVVGRPSWDVRFLRQHLKENPNVDLISFFILRTPGDDMSVRGEEMSLIPFPVKRLFRTEIQSFDVIVFQNFDFRPFAMAQYLPDIRAAVVDAGVGFIMIGGPQSFGEIYRGTPLEDILPVQLRPDGFDLGLFEPAPADAARSHPILRLAPSALETERAWREVPPLTAANLTGGPNAGAEVLLNDARGGRPLAAAMDAGKGRVLALASDALWRWRFLRQRGSGASERAYHRLWSNALRWLVRDPEHARVQVLPTRRSFDAGQAVTLVVKALGRDYRPLPSAEVQLRLLDQDGQILRTDAAHTSDAGGRHTYEGLGAGAYRVEGEVPGIGATTAVFVVRAVSQELQSVAPDAARMARLAQGGRAFDLEDDVFENLTVLPPRVTEVDARQTFELWDNGGALVLAVVVLAGEWWLRRRRGYL
jgi:uncharacterized membrane protein